MKKNIFFYFILLYFSFSTNTIIIIDAIYNFFFDDYILIYKNENLKFSKSNIASIESYFRIKKIENNSFYLIQHLKTNYTISVFNNETNIHFGTNNDKRYINKWSIINLQNNTYLIQNKNKCFLTVRNLSINCEINPVKNYSRFKLLKIYEEINENSINYELLEKEPIDVLIKYIDLRDPFLKRDRIHQIEKDFDNEELRYSVRSILKNIPWIRKIFILMPNEKVRYFKKYNLIKNKIVYVKDKDLLGFDSSNSLAFQFNYWKMKKFGISENFIAMDDDCFIGRPMKKSDFFYNENNKIIPLIITNVFEKKEKKNLKNKIKHLKNSLKKIKEEQTFPEFLYSVSLTYLFIINLFNKSIIAPKSTHNAIPVNLNELKEIYDLVYNSKYKSTILFSSYRHIESLQFQTFVLSFTFLKYNKKVKNISHKFISNKDALNANYNYHLFCINTNAYYNTNISFLKTRLIMEYLFPHPTPYEIIDFSIVDLSINLVKLMDKDYENKFKELKEKYKNETEKGYERINVIFELNNAFFIISLLCKLIFKLIIIQ